MRWAAAATLALVLAPAATAQKAGGPEIWFMARDLVRPYVPGGAVDFLDLFSPGAPWDLASSRIDVLGLFPDTPFYLSDDDWRRLIAELKRRKIALAYQPGPLVPEGGCGRKPEAGVLEGFSGVNMLRDFVRMKAMGAEVKYVTFDYPYYMASLYRGPGACNWPLDRVVENAVRNMQDVWRMYPDLIVGDIEGCPNGTVYDCGAAYQGWVDAWEAAAGKRFASFDADIHWFENWLPAVRGGQRAMARKGIPFGIFFVGWPTDDSDEKWIADTRQRYEDWTLRGGPTPQRIWFASWNMSPSHVLPESDPKTQTALVNTYFRERTTMTLTSAGAMAQGRVAAPDGRARAGVPVSVRAKAVEGPGVIETITLRGTVPAGAKYAVLQVCINRCGRGEQGTADVDVYSMQYNDTAWSFEKGFGQTYPMQGGTASIAVADLPGGKGVHFAAAPGEVGFLNSFGVAVKGGAAFEAQIRARVSPSSIGAGEFAVVILDDGNKELLRARQPFAPAAFPVADTRTGTDGAFTATLDTIPAAFRKAGVVLEASSDGNDSYWPAYASLPITAAPAIAFDGVVSGTTFDPRPIAPGAWFTIFGENLGEAGAWTSAGTTSIGGASVTVCGIPAVMSYASGPVFADGRTKWQLNALAPDAIAAKTSCPVAVTVNGRTTAEANLTIDANAFELFQFTIPAGAFPVLTHADYSVVTPAAPARPGEVMTAWGTGNCDRAALRVNGTAAPIAFASRVAPGLCQINFTVPAATIAPAKLAAGGATHRLALPTPPPRPRDDFWGWRFADTRYGQMGWTATGVDDLRIEAGSLCGTSAADNPQAVSPWFYGGAKGFSKLVIRIAVSADVRARVFWAIDQVSGFNATDVARFDATAGAMREYTIALPPDARRTGAMLKLRLDPAAAPGARFQIESIRLVE